MLQVALGPRSYAIHIGAGLLGDLGSLREALASRQVLVVTNSTVAPLYLPRVLDAFSGLDARSLVLPDGERYKTLDTLTRIFDALLEARFARDCSLVALGGGVIGDLTGFAAACYQRGVDFVQVPTTLLAQVDSSVGGKTGVNHALGKNMIGAFHQPRGVYIDTDTLETLPDRELSAGLAEVIKYGLIRDPDFFAWLERHMDALLARDRALLAECIGRCCRIKAQVVAADEREAGQRMILNLGHTFGHAIEAGMGYGAWLHGEAVAAGMCLAARLSQRLCGLGEEEVARVYALVERARLPCAAPAQLATARFIELMSRDKKVRGARLRFVLLEALGRARVCDTVNEDALERLLGSADHAA